MKKSQLALLGLIGVALVQSLYYYPQLPETVASHYGPSGSADGWSSKTTFLVLYIGLVCFMAGLFALLPRWVRRLPTSMINIPNKDYWLAPERREQTMQRFADQMLSFGIAVVLVLIVIFQLVFTANLPGSQGFSTTTMAIILGGFLLGVLVWTVRMLRAYRVPRS